MESEIEKFIEDWIIGQCRKFKSEIDEGCPWLEKDEENGN